jgi:hypothetical protein
MLSGNLLTLPLACGTPLKSQHILTSLLWVVAAAAFQDTAVLVVVVKWRLERASHSLVKSSFRQVWADWHVVTLKVE